MTKPYKEITANIFLSMVGENKHSRVRELNLVHRKSHGSKQIFKICSSIYMYLNRPTLKSH